MPKISIKAARVNAGLTQKEAAKQLGISNATLSKYESNEKSISLQMLDKMADLYRIRKDFIFQIKIPFNGERRQR